MQHLDTLITAETSQTTLYAALRVAQATRDAAELAWQRAVLQHQKGHRSLESIRPLLAAYDAAAHASAAAMTAYLVEESR